LIIAATSAPTVASCPKLVIEPAGNTALAASNFDVLLEALQRMDQGIDLRVRAVRDQLFACAPSVLSSNEVRPEVGWAALS